MLCCHSTTAFPHQFSPSYGPSCWGQPQTEPEAGLAAMLCSWWHSQLTLHSAHSQLLEETQISLLSGHALKDSPYHFWHCVTTISLENVLPLYVPIPRGKSPSCFQMQPILNGSMSSCGISHSIPCFPELQFCHWWVWWVYEINFISFSPIRTFHCTAEHTSSFTGIYYLFLYLELTQFLFHSRDVYKIK